MGNSLQSEKYQRVKNWLFFFGLFLDLTILCLFYFSNASLSLRSFAVKVSSAPFVFNGIYIFFFCVGFYLLHLPLSVFSGFIWEHKFQLSNQNFFQWFIDDLKKGSLSLLIVFLLIQIIYFFLRRFPGTWWISAGAFWVFFMFILAKFVPNVIVPLFYKYSIVEDEELAVRIKLLFKNQHVNLDNVYAIDMSTKTKKANAMLCGIGKNRRVVLSDTLMKQFSVDEIETVVAHEIGHYKHRDMMKLLAINAVIIFSGLFLVSRFLITAVAYYKLGGIDDIAFLPLLIILFMIFGLLTTPLINFISCWIETQADLFSLESTNNKEAFISMMKKLGELNMAEYKPGKIAEIFLYDHPPLYKRIDFAQKY